MYKLNKSVNPIEKNASAVIEDLLPNYETFWNRYLEPLKGSDCNWRSDTLHNLEEIGISQYGVLKSINFILLSKDKITVGDPLQHYKNIYFHFGLIFDSVENLARNICVIGNLLEIISLRKEVLLDKASLISKYENWIDDHYAKSFENMIDQGKPILFYPHRGENFIKLLLPPALVKDYNEFVTKIRIYRNFYIHTPGVDIILCNKKLFAIKNEYLRQYRHWSYIRISLENNPTHFDDPKIIVKNDLTETLNLLNRVWHHFGEMMDKISNHKKYAEFAFNYARKNKGFEK